jgi:hypothetical protein
MAYPDVKIVTILCIVVQGRQYHLNRVSCHFRLKGNIVVVVVGKFRDLHPTAVFALAAPKSRIDRGIGT